MSSDEVKITCITNHVALTDLGASLTRGQFVIVSKSAANSSEDLRDAKRMRAVTTENIQRCREMRKGNPAPPFNRNRGAPISGARPASPPAASAVNNAEIQRLVHQEMERFSRAIKHDIQAIKNDLQAMKHELLSEIEKLFSEAIMSRPVVVAPSAYVEDIPITEEIPGGMTSGVYKEEPVSAWGDDDDDDWDDDEDVFIPSLKVTGNFSSGASLISEDSEEADEESVKKLRALRNQQ